MANMFELQKKWREITSFMRQIKIVDGQIDRLVYDLYELTEEEVKVVKNGK